jgi:CHAT domain-containing protein
MRDRVKIACLSLLLLIAPISAWTLEAVGPASEAVLQQLREQEGADPTAEDLVSALNGLTVRIYQDGKYALAETVAREALDLGEKKLGGEHQKTLSALNNLAALIENQGRYGEAEPLYVRALEARERVLGKDHPDTLTTQLNLVVAQINTGHRGKALRALHRMDERLRRFVGAQLTTTLQKRVRRRWLVSESRFQDGVFSLALQHPQPDALRLAADVLLRWKRLAGESEAVTARLARSSRDPRVVDIAGELSGHRARLSRLVNLPEPDKDAIAAARADVERLEVALARLSREFQGHLSSRAVEWEQVQSALPRDSALLSLRAFNPVDFATRDVGALHWLALVIPADPGDGPEIVLEDLGPVAPTVEAHRTLRETGSEEAARALYRLLFGKLNTRLSGYNRLYIAPDGMLDLVAFARLVVPEGQYWAERQALHQLRTGRDLARQGSGKTAKGGMVIFGGVDYSGFSDVGAKSPTPVEAQQNMDDLLAMNRRLRDERGDFGPLKFTGVEAGAVGQFYWDHYSRKAVVWQNREATESRLKALDSPPRVLHLATHGFFLTQNAERTERPLTLAGLALAGANAGMKGSLSAAGEDGVLYALEAQDLNLEGTELVTLSACDTGRGQVDYSEGVYGLVRAFRIAGARNLLMTLWPLNDRLAADFMKDFYANWFADPNRHPAQALQETRLAWIRSKDPRRSDPAYWAPYVLIEGR